MALCNLPAILPLPQTRTIEIDCNDFHVHDLDRDLRHHFRLPIPNVEVIEGHTLGSSTMRITFPATCAHELHGFVHGWLAARRHN